MKPTLHREVPMGSRVRIPLLNNATGEVAGIASMHVIFNYIVILDIPLTTPEGIVKAVSIPGPELQTEDGTGNWKLEFPEIDTPYSNDHNTLLNSLI